MVNMRIRERDERMATERQQARIKAYEKKRNDEFNRLKGTFELQDIQHQLNMEQQKRNSVMPDGTKKYSAANKTELAKLAEDSGKDMWAIRNQANKYKAEVAKLTESFRERLDAVPEKERPAAMQVYGREFETAKAKLRERDAEARASLAASLKERAALAEGVHENLSNPIIAATLYGIGDTRRSMCEQSLMNAGPAVVAAAGERARITGDKFLAAAAFARNADLKKEQRPLNTKAYADMMFADEVAGVTEAVDSVSLYAAQAEYAVAEMNGTEGRIDKMGFDLKFNGVGNGDLRSDGTPKVRLDPTERDAPAPQADRSPNGKISAYLVAQNAA